MTLYDVQVLSESGRSGETIRVDAPDSEAAGKAALERVPEGWTVDRVSDASDHGEAWGVDTTRMNAPVVVERAEDVPPLDWAPRATGGKHGTAEAITEPESEVDEPTA